MSEFINTTTGEIVGEAYASSSRSRRKHRVTKYVGWETPFPATATTPEQLTTSLSQVDKYLNTKSRVNHALLSESITTGMITVQELALLTFLASSLTGWNYWIGTTTQLNSVVGERNLSRILKQLSSKGLIEQCDTKRHNRKILLHPAYAFKGGHSFQEQKVMSWLFRRK